MDVEYGIGVNNRYAGFYGWEEKDEPEPVSPTLTKKKGAANPQMKSQQQQKGKQQNTKGKQEVKQVTFSNVRTVNQKASEKSRVQEKSKATGEYDTNGKRDYNNARNGQYSSDNDSQRTSHYRARVFRRSSNTQQTGSQYGGNYQRHGEENNEANGYGGHSGGRNGDGYHPRRYHGQQNGRYQDRSRNYGERRNRDQQQQGADKNDETKSGNKENDEGKMTNDQEQNVTAANGDGEEVLNEKENDATADEANGGTSEAPNSETEQVETFTLKEWKAKQAHRETPVFNIRKPGEGEPKLGKLVPKKKDESMDVQEVEYENEEVYYPQRAGRFKVVADVGFKTGYQKPRRSFPRNDSGSTERPNHGGEGDGRYPRSDKNEISNNPNPKFAGNHMGSGRGYGRNGPRGRRPPPVPKIDDKLDFPTLPSVG